MHSIIEKESGKIIKWWSFISVCYFTKIRELQCTSTSAYKKKRSINKIEFIFVQIKKNVLMLKNYRFKIIKCMCALVNDEIKFDSWVIQMRHILFQQKLTIYHQIENLSVPI